MALILLTALGSCATASKGVAKYCPVPVHPDDCALEWIAVQDNYPACVDAYLNDVLKQQTAIRDNCKPVTP